MLRFTDATGLFSAGVVCVAAVSAVPGLARVRKSYLALVLAASAILAWMPLPTLPVAGYVRGLLGDLSTTTDLLLLCSLSRLLFGWGIDARNRLALQILVAVGGLLLYPLSLGLDMSDPYRLGYGNPWFLIALLGVALAGWSLRLHVVSASVAAAVLAWGVGWHESRNLWDYLLDPMVCLYGLGGALVQAVKASRGIRRSPGGQDARSVPQ